MGDDLDIDVLRPDEALAEWDASGGVEFVPSGVVGLDRATGGGVPVGQVSVLTGYTGVGKSELARQIGLHAGREGIGVIHVDVELGTRRIVERYLAQLAEVDPANLKFGNNPAVQKAREEWGGLPVRIIRPPGILPLEGLERGILWAREDLGTPKTFVILDSLQRLSMGVDENEQRLRVQNFMYWSAYFAEHEDLAVLTTSEQNRPQSDGKGGVKQFSPDAALKSSAESRAIEFTSDVHMVMYNEEGSLDHVAEASNERASRRVRILVTKNRPGGSLGWICSDLIFHKPHWGMTQDRPERIESLLVSLMGDGQVHTIVSLAKGAKKGRAKVKAALDEMIDAGTAEKLERGGKSLGYRLKGPVQ